MLFAFHAVRGRCALYYSDRVSMVLLSIFALCSVGTCHGSTNIFFFPNIEAMLHWEINSGFSSGTRDKIYGPEDLQYLPTNFFANLSNELTNATFNKLILHGNPLATNGDSGIAFALGISCGGINLGYSICGNWPTTAEDLPWLDRLRFYMDSRFSGHSADYVTQAIIEKTEGTNFALPLRFPKALKEEAWIASKWIEEDPMPEVDGIGWLDPGTNGMTGFNNMWIVRDGQFVWVYWLGGHGGERRDPKEYDPRYRSQFKLAAKEAVQAIRAQKRFIEGTYLIDKEIKRILAQKFGIDWLPPEELNNGL